MNVLRLVKVVEALVCELHLKRVSLLLDDYETEPFIKAPCRIGLEHEKRSFGHRATFLRYLNQPIKASRQTWHANPIQLTRQNR